MLVHKELQSQVWAERILSWRHSGFSGQALDAGIVSQNIALFCAGTGLVTRPRAGMKLTETQRAYLNHPVGYPK